jgi:hypothetical protein
MSDGIRAIVRQLEAMKRSVADSQQAGSSSHREVVQQNRDLQEGVEKSRHAIEQAFGGVGRHLEQFRKPLNELRAIFMKMPEPIERIGASMLQLNNAATLTLRTLSSLRGGAFGLAGGLGTLAVGFVTLGNRLARASEASRRFKADIGGGSIDVKRALEAAGLSSEGAMSNIARWADRFHDLGRGVYSETYRVLQGFGPVAEGVAIELGKAEEAGLPFQKRMKLFLEFYAQQPEALRRQLAKALGEQLSVMDEAARKLRRSQDAWKPDPRQVEENRKLWRNWSEFIEDISEGIEDWERKINYAFSTTMAPVFSRVADNFRALKHGWDEATAAITKFFSVTEEEQKRIEDRINKHNKPGSSWFGGFFSRPTDQEFHSQEQRRQKFLDEEERKRKEQELLGPKRQGAESGHVLSSAAGGTDKPLKDIEDSTKEGNDYMQQMRDVIHWMRQKMEGAQPRVVGGPVSAGQAYRVGEAGAEMYVPEGGMPRVVGAGRNQIFIPPSAGDIIPARGRADRRHTGSGPADIGPNYVDPGIGGGSAYSQLPHHGWKRDPADDPWSAALGKPSPPSAPGHTDVPAWATGRPQGPQKGKFGGPYSSVLPDWAQGIALPGTATLGKWYDVTDPRTGITTAQQQTDVGPSIPSRNIDISAAAAHHFGYTPKDDPTNKPFNWAPRDEPPPEARGLTDPVEQAIAVARARGLAPAELHRMQLGAQFARHGSGDVADMRRRSSVSANAAPTLIGESGTGAASSDVASSIPASSSIEDTRESDVGNENKGTMLILRGISGNYGGVNYPRGALDEPSASAYAKELGYTPRVLDVSGETGPQSAQTRAALAAIRQNSDVHGLLGFSGGGYNAAHIINQLNPEERARLQQLTVLGAPKNPESRYKGPWNLTYRKDPPAGHMAGPAALLAETRAQKEQERRSAIAPAEFPLGGFTPRPAADPGYTPRPAGGQMQESIDRSAIDKSIAAQHGSSLGKAGLRVNIDNAPKGTSVETVSSDGVFKDNVTTQKSSENSGAGKSSNGGTANSE